MPDERPPDVRRLPRQRPRVGVDLTAAFTCFGTGKGRSAARCIRVFDYRRPSGARSPGCRGSTHQCGSRLSNESAARVIESGKGAGQGRWASVVRLAQDRTTTTIATTGLSDFDVGVAVYGLDSISRRPIGATDRRTCVFFFFFSCLWGGLHEAAGTSVPAREFTVNPDCAERNSAACVRATVEGAPTLSIQRWRLRAVCLGPLPRPPSSGDARIEGFIVVEAKSPAS